MTEEEGYARKSQRRLEKKFLETHVVRTALQYKMRFYSRFAKHESVVRGKRVLETLVSLDPLPERFRMLSNRATFILPRFTVP